jgi:hypothetical protein
MVKSRQQPQKESKNKELTHHFRQLLKKNKRKENYMERSLATGATSKVHAMGSMVFQSEKRNHALNARKVRKESLI